MKEFTKFRDSLLHEYMTLYKKSYLMIEEQQKIDHYSTITRTALFYAAGVALYCTRMFTRQNEQATQRLQMTLDQSKLLFDGIDRVLKAGG